MGRDTVKVFLASRAGQVVRSMTLGPREVLLRMLEQVVLSRDVQPEIDVVLYGPEYGEFTVHF